MEGFLVGEGIRSAESFQNARRASLDVSVVSRAACATPAPQAAVVFAKANPLRHLPWLDVLRTLFYTDGTASLVLFSPGLLGEYGLSRAQTDGALGVLWRSDYATGGNSSIMA